MSLRPLYLERSRAWHVRLDGPALRIEAEGRAPTRVPLQKVARVVSPADAHWTTPALIACLQAGVPIVFTDAHGETLAWCFGPRKRETTLASLLRELFSRTDGDQLFDQWYRAAERQGALDALRRLGLWSGSLESADVRGRLCNAHRDRLRLRPGPLVRALETSASAFVAEELHKALGDPSLIGFVREGLHLGQRFSALLEWELHCILASAPLHRVTSETPIRVAARLVEQHGADLARVLGSHLGDLERCLREWLL